MDNESKVLAKMLKSEPMPSPNNEFENNLKKAETVERVPGRGIPGVTIQPLPTGQLIQLSSMSEALPDQSTNMLCQNEGTCSSATAPGVTG